MQRFIHIICFLSLWTGTISAQGIVIPFHYDYELSTTHISDITQDNTGKMWIATQDRLYSFDGYETRKFTFPPDKRITSVAEIRKIYADAQNRIWLALGMGIACLEQKDGTFTYYLPDPGDLLSMSNVVFDIRQDGKGTLYFATRNGIFTTKPQNIRLERFTDFPWHKVCSGYRKEERIVHRLAFNREGFLFAGTEGDGLSQINLQKGIRLHFKADSNQANSIASNEIKDIFEDSQGNIWVGTLEGLSSFDEESFKFTNWNLPEVTSICETTDHNLLLGLTDGCVLVEPASGSIKQLTGSLPSSRVTVVKQDRSGGIWIGTSKGLARYQPSCDFKLLRHDPGNIQSLASNAVTFLHAVPGENSLWIGYPDGKIDLYHPKTNRVEHYQINYPGEKDIQLLGCYSDRKKNFFVYANAGLLRFNPSTNRFEPFVFTANGQTLEKTYALIEDHQGNYWAGILDKGVFRIDGQTGSAKKVDISHEKIHQNIYTNIKLLHEDKNGCVWIVFWRAGILRYQPETKQEKLFTWENTQGELPNNTVWDVEETPDGIYISTSNGLAFWEFSKQNFSKQGILSGLRDIPVTGILGQDNGYLWLTTNNNGIIRLNTDHGGFIRFTESDGLQGKTFKALAHAQADSLLFFGGNDGLNYIDAHTLFDNRHSPLPVITKLKINGEEQALDQTRTGPTRVRIKASDQMEISFCSFSYQKEWRNNYKFRLTGQDSTIEKMISENQAKLSGLAPGSYSFALSASNCDGIWSPYAEVIGIKVHDFTHYYLAGIISIVLIVAPGLWQLRQRKHKRKKDRQEKQTNDPPPVDEHEKQLLEKFERLMQEEHLYLNKGIRKSEVAGALRIPEQQLTSLLRKRYGKSFPELINGYRVEAVKKEIRSAGNKDYTLLAIGEECGFNSKSSFYRIFKEHTGFTPAEYSEKNGIPEKSDQDGA